jgi:predicted kinase
MSCEQRIIILQGVPGSGKSTFARHLRKLIDRSIIVSADYFFIRDGVYQFDASLLGQAHRQCLRLAGEAVSWGLTVIVDNTNIRAWEAKPYVLLGQVFEVPIEFARCDGAWPNTHGVPQERVDAMRANLETLSVEACMQAVRPF